MKDNAEVKLQPDFSDLNMPETIIHHIEELTKEKEKPKHSEVFSELIKLIEPVDFVGLAFPESEKIREKINELQRKCQNEDGTTKAGDEMKRASEEMQRLSKVLENLKVTNDHYLILSIENLLKIVDKNNWGICKNQDFIYLYNGAYWKEIDKEAFQKFLGEAAEKMGVEKFRARIFHFREKLFKTFMALAYLPTPESNSQQVLVNFNNATLEIDKNGNTQLRKPDRSDFLTYQLGFPFDEKAEALLFKQYLNRVLPDENLQKILAEYLGFIFIKHGSKKLKEEKMLVLYGSGANGKSVFFEVVNALLGSENVSSYSLQELTDNSGYYRAMIANKLLNYASEINGKLEADIFKKMVSGEPLSARLPYGKPMTLEQYAKLIFNCNELPKDVEHTNAYFRRFLIIPFDVTIPENEQDKTLSYRIIESELSGVFNWALDGLKRLLSQQRFTKSDTVESTLNKYKTESNSVQMFLNEFEYNKSIANYRLIKDLFPEYRTYCLEDGISAFKKLNFVKQLRNLGYTVDTVGSNKLAVYIER